MNGLLARLQAAHTFDPVPMRAGVHGLHVPFDELLGAQETEASLVRAVLAFERTAVRGRSGVGKTSLIQWALDSVSTQVAALRVPVEAEDDRTVTEPGAFAAHLVSVVSRQLERGRALTPQDRAAMLAVGGDRTVTARRARRSGLALPPWLLRAEMATELEQVVTAIVPRDASEQIDQARTLIETVASQGLVPVVVIDDSDTWLSTAAGDRTSLASIFRDLAG